MSKWWRRSRLGVAGLLAWLALPPEARSQPPARGPESVLVVANRKSQVSGRIARYYALKRGLAADRLCWVDTSEEDEVTRSAYTATIEEPVRKCLISSGLVEKVLYIALTKGVPLRVSGGGQDLGSEVASTDSELTLLYARIHGQTFPAAGSVPNPFFRQIQRTFTHPQFPMYLVTRLDAYDFAAVKGLIDRALEAEKAPNGHGKVYLDMRDGSDADGESWLRDAAVLLPAGRAELEQTIDVVYGKRDAIGYASWGSNDARHKERRLNFQWLPGAIAVEYVSTDGRTLKRPPDTWRIGTWTNPGDWFAGSPQSMTGDFIEDGATGASGHVGEPYLHMTPHPDLLFPAYLGGRNLAESFYLSIPGLSWMNIMIGDPLCRLRK